MSSWKLFDHPLATDDAINMIWIADNQMKTKYKLTNHRARKYNPSYLTAISFQSCKVVFLYLHLVIQVKWFISIGTVISVWSVLHVYSLFQDGIRNNIYTYVTMNTVCLHSYINNNQLSFDADILTEMFCIEMTLSRRLNMRSLKCTDQEESRSICSCLAFWPGTWVLWDYFLMDEKE